jgi:DinB superfamily
MTNPYATKLGERNPLEVIAETPGILTDLVARIGPDGARRPWAPGKWTASHIVCHLADCEIAFAFRIRQTLAEPHHTAQPFDQDRWAEPYSKLEIQSALAAFKALRQWNLALVQSLKPEDFAKPLTHPERGTMTLQTIIETMGGHDLNHLSQLRTI